MSIVVLSPLTGWVAGLEEAPDEVFAGGVLGDGVAVDPTEGRLLAPCDGEIVAVAATRHAIAIRCEDGAEVLMHVGIDSVALEGAGFQVHVAVGQRVRAGEALLSFDLDVVARGARSLITPVLVSNPERFEIVGRAAGAVRAGELLLTLRKRTLPAMRDTGGAAPARASTRFVTGLPDGLHARPAARIVTVARSAGVEVVVGARGGRASAFSALALMGLGVRRGDEITLWADGARAEAAFTLLKEAFAAIPAPILPPDLGAAPVEAVLEGTRGSPGVAIGEAFHHAVAAIEPPARGAGVAAETQALQAAVAAVRARLALLLDDRPSTRSEILGAHLILLDDPALADAASTAIASGASAGAAWRTATQRQAALFGGGDRRLRERRADLLDLERQVLAALYDEGPAPQPPPGAIVLADELLPSELAALADGSVAGLAMVGGGATSHVAIMAQALGLPLLTAVTGLDRVPAGAQVILDADRGRLLVSPDAATVSDTRGRLDARARRRAKAIAAAMESCVTVDGRRIAIHANLGGPEDAGRAVAEGAEGCGLLRSEFLFQDHASAPDEAEQRAAYQAVADRLQGRPLTIRTLDVGSDKPAPYLPLPPEANPALGLRGVRVSLWRPELLRVQLRAILGVRGEVSILVPMVTSIDEIVAVRRILVEEAASMGRPPPPLGVMVETPAAALTVAALCEVAEFFSIGTNDLAQYTLAMDRTLPMLADRLDGLHPALVALMRLVTQAASAGERKVSVCGGLAGDPCAVPLLIGLGVSQLSLPLSAVAEVKALIRTLSAAECRAFADESAAHEDAAALRKAAARRWPQVGDGA